MNKTGATKRQDSQASSRLTESDDEELNDAFNSLKINRPNAEVGKSTFSLRKTTQMYVMKEETFNRSINGRVPPLTDHVQKTIRQKVSDYVQVAVEAEKERIEKDHILRHGTRRNSLAAKPAHSWKQKMSVNFDENEVKTFDMSTFIWDSPETLDFLSQEQVA